MHAHLGGSGHNIAHDVPETHEQMMQVVLIDLSGGPALEKAHH
jgi:hypothetical protein